MLETIELTNVGPAAQIRLDLGPRLNLVTGDNGLGKTFLLDVAWWALTRTWAGNPAWPHRDPRCKPRIEYRVLGKGRKEQAWSSEYRFTEGRWAVPRGRQPIPGLVIYARIDGGFSVWDPARNYWRNAPSKNIDHPDRPPAYHFTKESLWSGLYRNGHGQRSLFSEEEGQVWCNGLIRDWVAWQKGREPAFELLRQTLAHLSADPDEELRPGEPRRVSLDDVRDIPTLDLPYGTIPLTHASAGVRRIVALAYLIVWAWEEHRRAAELIGQDPEQRLVFLIDEVEAHLHPRWQRAILPALLSLTARLLAGSQVTTQIVAATHAPLVLASLEPFFTAETDQIFHLTLRGQEVAVQPIEWAAQGDVVGWLTSEVFGLAQARSREAERAIEAAEALMRSDLENLPEGLRSVDEIDRELRRVLAGHDPFWPRWIVHHERVGG